MIEYVKCSYSNNPLSFFSRVEILVLICSFYQHVGSKYEIWCHITLYCHDGLSFHFLSIVHIVLVQPKLDTRFTAVLPNALLQWGHDVYSIKKIDFIQCLASTIKTLQVIYYSLTICFFSLPQFFPWLENFPQNVPRDRVGESCAVGHANHYKDTRTLRSGLFNTSTSILLNLQNLACGIC